MTARGWLVHFDTTARVDPWVGSNLDNEQTFFGATEAEVWAEIADMDFPVGAHQRATMQWKMGAR